jgi:hypothetical protein
MADIKTALERVISEWEGKADNAAPQPEPTQKPKAHLFKATNGVTQATFDLVRANPGITRSEASRILEKQGYKPSSTASLVTAFVRQGQMEFTDGKLFTTSNEYVPLKTGKARSLLMKNTAKAKAKAKPVKQAKAAPVMGAGIAALKNPEPLAQVMQRSAIITTNFSVEGIIKNLTIYQAKELRDALNNLFK